MSAGRTVNFQNQSWGTPQKYVTAIKKFFGGSIALDPCSNEYSIVFAETEFMLPKHDGLKEDWNYPTIYMNPPYGSEILALVPVATNTGHWKQSIFGQARAICFLYDTRLKFLENGKDVGKGAPMSCAMIYWGADYKKFYDIFIGFGAVVDIENLKKKKIGNNRKMLTFEFEEETTYAQHRV